MEAIELGSNDAYDTIKIENGLHLKVQSVFSLAELEVGKSHSER